MTESLLEEARSTLEAARENPQSALERAGKVVKAATGEEELATAHFAIGLAHRTLANGALSTQHLEQAAQCATVFAELHGQILRSLAFNYAQSGQHRLADETIESSIAMLSGEERDLSRLQQAFMLLMRGDHRRALPVLDDAIAAFEKTGHDDYLELTLYNRALIHMEMGDYDSSVSDLERAYDIAIRIDHPVFAANAALHLSQVLGWRDDIPAAMDWHSRSVELHRAAGADNPVADAEHAFLLIQARLMREAEEVLTAALPRLVAAGDNEAIAVQGHLLLAEVLTARGAHGPAAEQIAMARGASPSDGRYRFDIAAADHRTRIAAGEATTALLNSIVTTANDMEANGERHSAAMERFRAVDVALRTGDLELAARMCDDTARIVRSGPLWLQIQAWTALAAVRMTLGNTRGAAAAVRAGFNRLDEYRRGIGATDLRIHAAEYGERLAAMGLQLAIESGSVGRVYDWAERLRTTALHTPPRATVDPGLQETLSQLRRLSARVRSADDADSTGLAKELRLQEEAVRASTRRAAGGERAFEPASLPSLQAELTDHALIEYVFVNGNVHAVVATSTVTQLIDLGPSPDTEDLIDQLRAASDRIARPSTSDASRAAALASVTETADHIRETLIGPLQPLIGRRRPVIIPAGGFHGIPWGHVIDGPVEVAPSATVWLNCRGGRMAACPPVIVSGPDLTHAADEVAAIAAIAAAPTHSTAEAVLRRLPDARLAHFACHARARFDSPMFSSLLLDDGEVTLYDIEQLHGAPQTVILAACDSGGAVIASGDEVISLAGAFLSLGSRTVVAPLFTVSDAATAAMMICFHEQLAAGADAAAALAELRSNTDPVVAFTARSFVCFGTA